MAAENETKVDDAYDCLEEKVDGRCSSLSSEERIFSLLAIGECSDEVEDDTQYMVDLKFTAQAVLGLDAVGVDTEDAEEWLLEQNATPDEMEWLLQIESTGETGCTITYEGLSNPININVNEDKTVSGASGCFNLYGGGYWLRVLSSCYDYEFEISCDQSFSTNLLYKKTSGAGSDVIYVSEETHSAAAEGSTTERVSSFCFAEGGEGNPCDYEASLWAAYVLNYRGYDVSSFLPYLITMADENSEYVPESFLYSVTNEFRNELLSKQKNDQWWLESEDKYYDTAVALLPFQNEEFDQKTNTKDWLLEDGVQGTDGCWDNGNIRNTAFILYSIWPRNIPGVGDGGDDFDCEDSGGYCMSLMSCEDATGEDLGDEYSDSCFGANICCSEEKPLGTCEEQGGEICEDDETCSVSTVDASDTSDCCTGNCRQQTTSTECELYADGNCRTSCYSDEEESEDYECSSGDVCCIEITVPEKGNYWWIWVLLIMIVLAVIGIIFKDKLRPIWFKIRSKFGGKSKPGPKSKPGSRPGFRPLPGRPSRPIQRPAPGMLPPGQRAPIKKSNGKSDMDDVLKKLKEMGK